MNQPVAVITRANGQQYILSLRELAAFTVLVESEHMKRMRDGLFKAYMETAQCEEAEAKAIIGPLLLQALVDEARELAKIQNEDDHFVSGMQAVVKKYAEDHPGEIVLPCDKHHRLPCRECGIGVQKQ